MISGWKGRDPVSNLSGTGSNQATHNTWGMTTKNRPCDCAIQQPTDCIYRPGVFLLGCRSVVNRAGCCSVRRIPTAASTLGFALKAPPPTGHLIASPRLTGFLHVVAFRLARELPYSLSLAVQLFYRLTAACQDGVSAFFQGTSAEKQDTHRSFYLEPLQWQVSTVHSPSTTTSASIVSSFNS